MAFDPVAAEKRLEDIKAQVKADREAEYMYRDGFENADDWQQWKLLEELREYTKANRTESKPQRRVASGFPLAA